MCLSRGERVAAIVPPAVGMSDQASWHTYLATTDIDACALRVEANGGKLVVLPLALADLGHFALAADPEAAIFGLWQCPPEYVSHRFAEPGALCWYELYARNVAVVDPFYQGLFCYEQEQVGDGIDFDFVLWKIMGEPVCGRLRMQYEAARIEPHWKTYFTVDDCAEAEAIVVQEGGKVLVTAYDVPHGRVAMVADPMGAPLAICQHTGRPFVG